MKRRLQTYLEKRFGSPYSTDRGQDTQKNKAPSAAAQPPLLIAGEGEGEGGKKKGKALKSKNKPQRSHGSSPAGERFDLRCGMMSVPTWQRHAWRRFLF